eukprot:g22539.t1
MLPHQDSPETYVDTLEAAFHETREQREHALDLQRRRADREEMSLLRASLRNTTLATEEGSLSWGALERDSGYYQLLVENERERHRQGRELHPALSTLLKKRSGAKAETRLNNTSLGPAISRSISAAQQTIWNGLVRTLGFRTEASGISDIDDRIDVVFDMDTFLRVCAMADRAFVLSITKKKVAVALNELEDVALILGVQPEVLTHYRTGSDRRCCTLRKHHIQYWAERLPAQALWTHPLKPPNHRMGKFVTGYRVVTFIGSADNADTVQCHIMYNVNGGNSPEPSSSPFWRRTWEAMREREGRVYFNVHSEYVPEQFRTEHEDERPLLYTCKREDIIYCMQSVSCTQLHPPRRMGIYLSDEARHVWREILKREMMLSSGLRPLPPPIIWNEFEEAVATGEEAELTDATEMYEDEAPHVHGAHEEYNGSEVSSVVVIPSSPIVGPRTPVGVVERSPRTPRDPTTPSLRIHDGTSDNMVPAHSNRRSPSPSPSSSSSSSSSSSASARASSEDVKMGEMALSPAAAFPSPRLVKSSVRGRPKRRRSDRTEGIESQFYG